MLRVEYKSKVKEIAPDRLHPLLKGVHQTILPEESNPVRDSVKAAPHTLPKKNINNVTIHPNREDMLTSLPKKGTVAELGVDEGDFSEKILSTTNPTQLFLVDVWDSERYNEKKMRNVKRRFDNDERVSIIRERSEVALKDFEDDFFDWVYIDTDHSYEQTLEELSISQKKVNKNGIITGHDYCVGNPSKGFSYGVIPAVHAFCVQENWEITHLSLETNGHSSFALEKITT